MQEAQGIIGTWQHSDFLLQHWGRNGKIHKQSGEPTNNSLKSSSSDTHAHAGCLCWALEIMSTQLQQSERSAQKGKSEGKGTNTTHAKFSFYFSVDKTQRSSNSSNRCRSHLQKWHLFSISLHTQVCQVYRDCMLTQYRHCSVVTEIKFLGIF